MAKRLEVLCAAMHRCDFSLFSDMNIQSDVLFANQADRFAYEETELNGYRARMITTAQRGVGNNRNQSLLFAEADICLLSDEDVVLYDGYAENIIKAFEELPQADMLIFGMDNSTEGSVRKPSQIHGIKRMRRFSRNPYGGPRIAFRLESIRKANFWFTTLFGGGCRYPSGEDSLFIHEALKKGLRVYTYPYTVGQTDYENSTWFDGYGEKYFFGKGAYFKAAHPASYPLWMAYCAARTTKKSSLPLKSTLRWLKNGVKAYQESLSYAQWIEKYESRQNAEK